MGILKRTWKRFAAWWGKGGSGGGPSSSGYNEARLRTDIAKGYNDIGPTG